MKVILRILAAFILFSILFSCATSSSSDENAPIDIKNISILEVENRAPKESDYQVEIELTGNMSSKNANQDIDYQWNVEYLNLDIRNEKQNDSTDDSFNLELVNNFLEGHYFLEVSNNPLKSLLSIYKPGYYKITLKAYNEKEKKSHTILLKIGEPELPNLFVKVNIPEREKYVSEDFKGNIYLNITNKTTNDIISQITFFKFWRYEPPKLCAIYLAQNNKNNIFQRGNNNILLKKCCISCTSH
jgi:hypothetical protein